MPKQTIERVPQSITNLRGTLSPGFGRYYLALELAERLTLHTATKKLTMEQVMKVLTLREPVALLVEMKYLPISVLTPFLYVGGRFVEDVKMHCDGVIFTPSLTNEQKVWRPGFEVNMATAAPQEFIDLFSEPIAVRFDQVMFLNCCDTTGRPWEGEALHWVMAWLLGRMKVSHLLAEYGYPAGMLDHQARSFFADVYQHAFLSALYQKLATLANAQGFSLEEVQQYTVTLEKLKENVTGAWPSFPLETKKILRDFLGTILSKWVDEAPF